MAAAASAHTGAERIRPSPDSAMSKARFISGDGEGTGSVITRSYIAVVRSAIRSRVNSCSNRSRPARPIRARSSASPASVCSAAARASLSPGGTTRPVTPSTFTQGTPVARRVLITGFARAIASSCTSPNASARVTDGSTNRSHAAYHAATASSSSGPRKKMRDSSCRSRLRRSSSPRIGPSPITTAATSARASARSSTSAPL